jgi:hypothetical protein
MASKNWEFNLKLNPFFYTRGKEYSTPIQKKDKEHKTEDVKICISAFPGNIPHHSPNRAPPFVLDRRLQPPSCAQPSVRTHDQIRELFSQNKNLKNLRHPHIT